MKYLRSLALPVFLSLCIVMAASCTSFDSEQALELSSPSIIKSPNDPREYAYLVLDNGFKFVLVSDPNASQSSAAVSVGVGSMHEPDGFGGLAHYLEHMLFMGTEGFPSASDYSEFVAKHGGDTNAFTDLHQTNYMLSINHEAFGPVLDRFSRFFYEALLDERYASKERHAVDAEWKMKRTDDWVMLEALNGATLHPAHPLRRFNWGNLSTLADQKQLSLQQALVHFYQTYYSADVMTGTLVSPLPIDALKSLALRYFSPIKSGLDISLNNDQASYVKTTDESFRQVVSDAEQGVIIRYRPQSDMRQLHLSFVINDNSQQFTSKPNAYLAYLLSSEMPGTFASQIKQLGLSEGIHVYYDPALYKTAGAFSVQVDLTEQGVVQRDTIIGLFFNYLDLIQIKGISSRYFNEIQQSLDNQFRFKDMGQGYEYALELATALQTYPAKHAVSHAYEYAKFSPKSIHHLIKQMTPDKVRLFFIDKQQAVVRTIPYFSGKYQISPILQSDKTRWRDVAVNHTPTLPTQNTLMATDFQLVTDGLYLKPKQLIDLPGFSVFLSHSQHFKVPKGKIIIEFNTDKAKASARQSVMSSILSQALIDKLSAITSEAWVAGIELYVSVENGLQITINGYTDKQSILLSRLLSDISTLKISASQLGVYKTTLEADIRNRGKKILLDQLFVRFRQVLNFDNYSDQALLDSLDKISLESLNMHLADMFTHANLRVLAHGNYTDERLTSMAQSALALLPENRDFMPLYVSEELEVKVGLGLSFNQYVTQEGVAFVDTYMRPLSFENLATGYILQDMISVPLFEQIRTEEQLAYSVGFFNQALNRQWLFGFYVQSSKVGLPELYKRIDNFRQTFITQLKDLSEEQFEEYKRAAIVEVKRQPANLDHEFSPLYDDWRLGRYQFDSQKQLIAALEGATKEGLLSLYTQIQGQLEFGQLLIQLQGDRNRGEGFVELDNVDAIPSIEAVR